VVTPEGLAFIKSWEGFRSRVYLCASKCPTIGFGHAILSLADKLKYTSEYVMSKEEAEELLAQDMVRYEGAVDKGVKVPISPSQRDALVSFCYNVGIGAFFTSTLLRKLNTKDYIGASKEFGRWCRGGGRVIEGLSRRREAERRMFVRDMPANKVVKFALRFASRRALHSVEGKHYDEYHRFAKCV
jgi:lysozyme